MNIGFKRTRPEATIPTFGHNDRTNAGMDFYSCEDISIYPKTAVVVDTGIAWDGMPLVTNNEKPVLVIQSRSGLSVNHSIEACNAGVIDAGYTGSIRVKLYNNSEVPFKIIKGDRIAQGIVYMLPVVTPVEIQEIGETIRGDKGFGSSGR